VRKAKAAVKKPVKAPVKVKAKPKPVPVLFIPRSLFCFLIQRSYLKKKVAPKKPGKL
jgi:hypothetical protein